MMTYGECFADLPERWYTRVDLGDGIYRMIVREGVPFEQGDPIIIFDDIIDERHDIRKN